jgi:hypothetical protein
MTNLDIPSTLPGIPTLAIVRVFVFQDGNTAGQSKADAAAVRLRTECLETIWKLSLGASPAKPSLLLRLVALPQSIPDRNLLWSKMYFSPYHLVLWLMDMQLLLFLLSAPLDGV